MKGFRMIIRKARLSDSKAIASLLSQLGYPSNIGSFQRRLKNLAGRLDLILVAVEGHKVLGFISLHLIPMVHEEGFLGRVTALVVDVNRRGKGVGRKLLGAAEAYARKKGAVKAEITSREPRKGAHAFYRGMGYKEYRTRFLKRFKKT